MAETGEKPIKVLDLFSGIGGFSLGLERAGMQTVAFCEWDKKAAAVLRKHWPSIPVFDDVRTLEGKHVGSVDLICGGFPCQDISVAGKGAGLAGARSGLWWEFHRLIQELQPKYALIENVSALRSRGLDEVLRSLAQIGYDAEWHCVPASAVGAPHRRDRIWIVAYPQREGFQRLLNEGCGVCQSANQALTEFGNRVIPCGVQWPRLSDYLRVGYGIPGGAHRLKQLGNAVVPQIPEIIGKAIIQWEKQHGR